MSSITRAQMQIYCGGRSWSASLEVPIEIGLPLDFMGAQPQAFFLPRAEARAFAAGDFVGDVAQGGSVNCFCVELAPHGNGTHTECVGHITRERVWVHDILRVGWSLAVVLRVSLCSLKESGERYAASGEPDDLVVSAAALERCWLSLSEEVRGLGEGVSWVIRTSPGPQDRQSAVYSGQRPPYLTEEAMHWVVAHQPAHLLVDLPSVDREEDEGLLPNHHAFWGVPLGSHELVGLPSSRTITEMIDVPAEVTQGVYLLELQIPAFCQDAAPSRPRLYEVASER